MKRMRTIAAAVFMMFLCPLLAADNSWILPDDSLLYRRVEELYISAGWNPPLDERPLVADYLIDSLERFIDRCTSYRYAGEANEIIGKVRLPFEDFSPIFTSGFQANRNTETGRLRRIKCNDYDDIIDYFPMYEIHDIPSMIRKSRSTRTSSLLSVIPKMYSLSVNKFILSK